MITLFGLTHLIWIVGVDIHVKQLVQISYQNQ